MTRIDFEVLDVVVVDGLEIGFVENGIHIGAYNVLELLDYADDFVV
jgi:hypothetical protein